ncbi:hypothetical protein VCM39_04055 [Bacteroides sp. CG01]|uniref:hypothetical protein n=1 Tax=Bacteroides sp. CG01 TaxID=3096000 RepID=UPI002AFFD421|nr:hypothetical protein [Bacteroides sp. CG01]
MSRNEPIIRERTAITVPVQNLYDKKQSTKKKKECVCLTLCKSDTTLCVRLISGTDATHAVANTRGMEKGELRLALTLTGRQQQPSALSKHSRQPFLCPFGDTSPLP